ncbi:MAG TPA: glutamate-cysteine ligase family protein, partial [Thermoanaerobaculia bacterium]|nr:glutamate-cysteine ligase family protein [Thermoanaerobaculia bacterium]
MSAGPRLGLFEATGIELEYMLVDRESLAVMPRADEVLAAAAGEIVDEIEMGEIAWSNELVLHLIELKTNGPTRDLRSALGAFQDGVRQINRLLQPLGGRLMPGAMHPWMDPD